MYEGTNTQTKNDQYTTVIDVDSTVIEKKEELDYKSIDTRINTIPIPMNGGIKFMIEVPVPIVNWELDLSLYEKGVLFFTKMNDIGSVLIKIIKFLIIIWTPLNYIKQFINERRKT